MTDFEKTVKTMQPVKLEKIGEGLFNAHLAVYSNGWKAVCKHDPSNKVFRQLPTRLAHRREAAFYRFSQLFYPGVVPETYVVKVKGVECSAQMFVPGMHARAYDKKLFDTERDDFSSNFKHILYKIASKPDWKRLVMLDVVGNSRDRHGKNIIVRPKFPIPLSAIDNGFSLGKTFRSYRNVFHRYLFKNHFHAPAVLKHLEKIQYNDIKEAIVPLLDAVYAYHAMKRLEWVLEFPHRLPYRVFSQGAQRTVEFPSYKKYFSSEFRRLPEKPLLVKSVGRAA